MTSNIPGNNDSNCHSCSSPTNHHHGYHYAKRQGKQPNNNIRPRVLYGAIWVWLAFTSGQFLAPYLESELGMSDTTIGLCLALQSALMTVGSPLVGPLADRREFHRPGRGRAEVLALGIAVASFCSLSHGLVHVSWSFFRQDWFHILLRMLYAASSCCVFSVVDAMTLQYLDDNNNNNDQNHCQCQEHHHDCPTNGDNTSSSSSGRTSYGRERLYGAVTWGVVNLVYGYLIDSFGFGRTTYPLIVMGACLALWVISLYAAAQQAQSMTKPRISVVIDDEEENEDEDEEEDENGEAAIDLPSPQTTSESVQWSSSERDFSGCAVVVGNAHNNGDDTGDDERTAGATAVAVRKVVLSRFFGTSTAATFMICFAILSFGQAIVDQLVFLFLETLSSSYTLMGITIPLTVAFEIPIFHVAPIILEKTSAGTLLLVACLSYVVRVLGYAAIPKGHVAYILFLEPLHGVTFACAQTASVDTAACCSPKGWEATGQGLMALVKGAGSMLGLLYGGWAVEHLGGRLMYRMSAAFVALGALTFLAVLVATGTGRNHANISISPAMKLTMTPSFVLVAYTGLKQQVPLETLETSASVTSNSTTADDCCLDNNSNNSSEVELTIRYM